MGIVFSFETAGTTVPAVRGANKKVSAALLVGFVTMLTKLKNHHYNYLSLLCSMMLFLSLMLQLMFDGGLWVTEANTFRAQGHTG